MVPIPRNLAWACGLAAAVGVAPSSSAAKRAPNWRTAAPHARADAPLSDDQARQALADALAQLIADAIPVDYDRQEDWGAQKRIAVGLRTEGKGLKTRIKRRKKLVDHGVWKHYRIRIVDPETNLRVSVDDLAPVGDGRVGFTLRMVAPLDAWARAKVYQYGVHLIALEAVGDLQMDLAIDCEVAIELRTIEGRLAVVVVPEAKSTQLTLRDFHIRRVSNLHGPLVRELSGGVRRVLQRELDGQRLTAKINRSIAKRRDRLAFSLTDFANSGWRPAAANSTLLGDPTSDAPGETRSGENAEALR